MTTAVIDPPRPPKSVFPPSNIGGNQGFGGGGGGGDGDAQPNRGTSGPPFSVSRLGLMIVIGSIVMLFGGFLSVYVILRFSMPVWPPAGALPMPKGLWISTALIFLSHFTARQAMRGGRERNTAMTVRFLGATLALGVFFCATQAYLWRHLVGAGMAFNGSVYSANFYCITAVHFLHIIFGLIYMTNVLVFAKKKALSPLTEERIGNATIYWHFVGILWYVLFVAVCLV